MGLSIVIYQALIYVGIFFLLFLSASYLANKIKKNNSGNARRRARILTNHMESIQSRIKQAEQKTRGSERSQNYQETGTKSTVNIYYDKNRMNRDSSNYEVIASQYHFVPNSTMYRDQITYRSTAYYSGGESVYFR